ncbi:hypothetical protein Tco_1163395 [Tanacetum coccineum]
MGVLSVAKVLADAAKVHTYTRRRRAVSTASGGISTAKESVSTAGASMPVSTAGIVQDMSLDEELAQKLHEEEQARFNAEQEAKFNPEQEELLASETTEDVSNPSVADVDWDDVQAQIQADEDLAQRMLEEERESLSIAEKGKIACRIH